MLSNETIAKTNLFLFDRESDCFGTTTYPEKVRASEGQTVDGFHDGFHEP